MSLLGNLGRQVLEKRGTRGVREVAREIGISHATLSRVERGFHPDLENYQKITLWLGLTDEPRLKALDNGVPQVHFRRDKTVTQETAMSLANMILAAQANWPGR
ncbi:helix-turn-helix protein [Roseiarcus fermentans]|uniref:Helix-turn-helix protein n=1 Tax=Roseiarcus fermentans TaxID=1473586 RepID=A0A366FV86_9HYPH|nr:helix-turn-helix transcriptional regulator [Roseiarcus fermentans]RBP18066.1 helix-turn-helix protein [Roseiarcus fermentans]